MSTIRANKLQNLSRTVTVELGDEMSAGIGYLPAGTGAVATDVQSKLREFVSVLDFIHASEHADIKAGTSTYDCTSDIQDAVNAAKAVLIPDGHVFRVTAEIVVPQGVYIYGHGEIFVDQPSYVRAISLGSDCTVEGVIFRGTGVATALDGSLVGGRRGVAVAGFNVANVKVLGCKFYDFISTALNSGGGVVQFSSTHNLEVSGCYFDTSNDGFDDISAGYRVGDAVFDRNVSYSNSDIFISVSSVGGEVIGTSEFTNTANHIVTNNIHIKNRWEPQNVGRDLGRHGIAAHYDGGLSYLVATNNVIGNVSRHGLYLRGPSTVPSVLSGPNIVSSNYLLYCGSGEASNYCSGIRVETTLPTIIANNYIHKTGYFPTDVAGTSPAYDIESVRGMQDVSISGNTLMHGKDGSVFIRTTVSDRTIRNVVVKDNTIHTSAFGVHIYTGHASTVLDDVVISGNYIKLTGATYLGAGGAARAAGIATEIASGTTSTAYTLSISGNTVTGTGTTADQYGVALLVSSTQLQKCIIKDNKFHNLEFGFATRRFEFDGVSYIPHRIIGTSVRLVRNQFVTCGTALFFSQTAATQLFVADESNVYDGCTSTGIGTAITWNAALEGKCTGRDASGNLLIEYQASAIPTAQQYYQGDRIINTNPVAGGFTGWVCTVSGTPGTWKGYGVIEA